MLGRGLIGAWMEDFFVEMDSYAIAFFRLALRGGKEGGNSMGLILEARSPIFLLFSTSLNLGSSGLRVVLRCQNRSRRQHDVSGQTGQASFKTLFNDDTTHIESST